MKELLLYVAKNLVDHPDAVSVTQTEGEDGTLLELRVASEEMGKVIGRQGRIAKEIRTIVKPLPSAMGRELRWTLSIKTNGIWIAVPQSISLVFMFRLSGGTLAGSSEGPESGIRSGCLRQ